MRIPTHPNRQQGVALFLGLIMLLVLTVLGISSFQNSHIQERAAGNARLQSVAFEAAAAGASNAINFFDANRELGPDELCGAIDHEGWADATAWVTAADAVGEATLKQRMYCLADEYPTVEDEDDPCGEEGIECRPGRSQLFVLSRGEVFSGGNIVAQRDVEVRLDLGALGAAGDGCGALCFPSCEGGSYTFPTSNAFQVNGGGGPAITGGCAEERDAIREGIRDNRIGNYQGGVASTTPGSPWDQPFDVDQFRLNVRDTAIARQTAGNCLANCYNGGNVEDMGNSQYGAVGFPQVTYIEGNAEMGGDISGAGILMVYGNLIWNGTPNFQGLIVVLGGEFEVIGGGTGGNHAGSVVTLNLQTGELGLEYGPSTFDVTGGGVAQFNFDCDALWAAHGMLDDEGQHLWSPECDTGPETPFDAGPEEMIIASWRENIGWREDFFGSEEE